MESSLTESREPKGRGWKAFPFITGGVMGINLVVTGVQSNLVVYLMQQYNMGSIESTQTVNALHGFTCILPFAGGIISDSGVGCFAVIAAASLACFLSMVLCSLVSTLQWLRPAPCSSATTCDAATDGQLLVLYTAMSLMAIGFGGTRFNGATMGANQFENKRDQATFFDWYFAMVFLSTIAGQTVIVYVQDNAGWTWGYCLCAAIAAVGTVLFVGGSRYYQNIEPQENAFLGIFQAAVSAVKTKKMGKTSEPLRYYEQLQLEDENSPESPRLIDIEEQAEYLKAIMRVLPVISATITVSTSISFQSSMTTLQAFLMDRHLGPLFLIPPGSISVFVAVSSTLSVTILNRLIFPAWQRLTGGPPTPIHRIAMGHIIHVLVMLVSAVTEAIRLNSGSNNSTSVFLLVPSMILVGLGDALSFPGQVALCYEEFPPSLRCTATSMVSVMYGIGFYLSAGVAVVVKMFTGWLEDDLNQSRLDNVYWMLTVAGLLSLTYFFLCARWYARLAR